MFGKVLRFNDLSAQRRAAATDPGPTNLELDRRNPSAMIPPITDAGAVPQFKYPFSMAHKRLYDGGWSHEVTIRELPISTTLAGVLMRLTAGGIRELHWHTAAEWAIMLNGGARVTAIDADGKPVEVPAWEPKTDEEKSMRDYAIRLMELRKGIEAQVGPLGAQD